MDNQDRDELLKVASYYDQLGREFFHKTAFMEGSETEYGIGSAASKAKTGFANLVKKIMGKLKAGRLKGRSFLKRRK